MAAGLCLLARVVGTSRFYAYAALALFIFLGGEYFAIDLPISVSLLAAVMLLGGLLVLFQFLTTRLDISSSG